jgi:transcriptional antiterminator NusG
MTTKRWYVVHAYSGMEKSVGRALQERVERAGMQDMFGKILVPTEEVVEMKNGQRTISERRFFPGYVLVEMEMNDDTWHLVKNTNKVTGFVGGSGNKPAPISQKEVDKIMSQMAEGVEKPKPKTLSRWAKWCGCGKAPSPTSTATSKTSTTRKAGSACRSPSSAGRPRSNSSSARSRNCRFH